MSPQFAYITDQSLPDIIANAIAESQNKRLLNANEVGEMLQLDKETVLRNKQAIGFVKLGKSVLFKYTDVHRYIQANYVKPSNSNHHV